MKRSAVTTLNDIPAKKSDVVRTFRQNSILEQGKIYFTPIGGITVPRSESEGSLSLDEIIGDIRPISSLHLSFLLDFSFLISCYPTDYRNYPMKLVVGAKDAPNLEKATLKHNNVTVVGVPLEAFGTHHTKMSLFESADGRVHVIVSTANLVSDDWEFKTQQFYYAVGDKRPSEEEAARSPFQLDLIEYLGEYRNSLTEWKDLVNRTDFSEVPDRLVFSTPGRHTTDRRGHPRLGMLLSEKFPKSDPPAEPCSYIAQCSSIGSLGATAEQWYLGEFLRSMEGANPSPKTCPPRNWLVFPCVEDIRRSCRGYISGTSVPYQMKIHGKQTWLQRYMCKWRSNRNRRTNAAPHCKTYGKFENRTPKWQLMTSANLSKAAWGERKKDGVLHIRSYEMGVLITDPNRFNFPFDHPLTRYSEDDQPFTTDTHHNTPDEFNQVWTPPRIFQKMTSFKLSYGSVNLDVNDIEMLENGGWFNDKLLSFIGEYLMDTVNKRKEMANEKQLIHVFTPPETEMIRHAGSSEEVEMFFGMLGVDTIPIVAFIVNDNADVMRANGGSHWSLLVWEKRDEVFRHFDSIPGNNHQVACKLMEKARSLVRQQKPQSGLQLENVIKQDNSRDCGLFAAEYLWVLAHEESAEAISGIRKIEHTRQFWRDLIVNF